MKNLITLCFLCSLIYASEGVNLTKNLNLSTTIKPMYVFSTITVESSSKLRNIGELNDTMRKSITTSLNSIIEEAKKEDICKGGGYAITPIINYNKSDRKTIGQNVEFNLECKFAESDLGKYNNLLAKINQITTKNNLLALPQPKLTHRITNEEISGAKENLFESFLQDTQNIEQRYSKLLNKKCSINDINTQDNYSTIAPRMMMANAKLESMADSTFTTAPIADTTEVSINVNFKLLCK